MLNKKNCLSVRVFELVTLSLAGASSLYLGFLIHRMQDQSGMAMGVGLVALVFLIELTVLTVAVVSVPTSKRFNWAWVANLAVFLGLSLMLGY